MDYIPMTKEGLEKLREKLKYLTDVERPRLEKSLGDAREQGDISENAEFDEARRGLWMLDEQVGELQTKIACAQIIDGTKVIKDKIAFGSSVKVKDLDHGDIDDYQIVGEGESDPRNGKVGLSTPLAQALVGKKPGDKVEYLAPGGKIRLQIIEFKPFC
ncbi:MAG: transcription elongation factor GreA [Planctomycetes bacterium]|nr:transcription elongation factor GreA [Planctomycetota bacterium]